MFLVALILAFQSTGLPGLTQLFGPKDCMNGPINIVTHNWPQVYPPPPGACPLCIMVSESDPNSPGGLRLITSEVCDLSTSQDYSVLMAVEQQIMYCGIVDQPTWESLGVFYSPSHRLVTKLVSSDPNCPIGLGKGNSLANR